MFERSRRKIVAVIMAVLVALLAGTLCVIYISSYVEVYRRDQDMLARYIELYSLEAPPGADRPPEHGPGEPVDGIDAVFRLSTFYSVAVAEDGGILMMDNDDGVYPGEYLAETAVQIISQGRTSGTRDSLIYRCGAKDGYTITVFMDNTIVQESTATLFRYTLIFGVAAIIAIFFLARHLAGRIVRPLEESYRKQKQFISDAGHELKTPIAVVGTNAELLSRELGQNRWLENIRHENARMGTLVGRLLELARTEDAAPRMGEADLSRLVTGEVLPFESVAFERGLTLRSDVGDGVAAAGNDDQLRQLVSILLDNAIRHGKTPGTVDIRLKKERGAAVLTVTNEGDPIPPQRQKQLFERFYRTDEARTGEGYHYGLGLAIAKAIVTAHKGKIEVSCHDGLVEFRVSLPAP